MKKIIGIILTTLLLASCQKPVVEEIVPDDISNLDEVYDFAYEYYDTTYVGDNKLSKEIFLDFDTVTSINVDLNGDDIDDVLVYSGNYADIVIPVTVANNKFEVISNEIELLEEISQVFTIEDNFIVRKIIKNSEEKEIINLYIPKEDMIHKVEGDILISSVERNGVKDNLPIYLSSLIEGDWTNFTKVIEAKKPLADTDEVLKVEKYRYTLEEENYKYLIKIISGFEKAEDEYIYPREKVSPEEFPESDFAKRVPYASYSEYIESLEHRFLINFQPETFGENNMDYEKYYTVIVPMYTSINRNFVDKRTISFEGDYINELKFTVFGEFQDVVVNQYNSMDGEPEQISLGTIVNEEVTIMANLPNDMSRVEVLGRVYEGEGYYNEVKFVLDNMRELSEYELVTYSTYAQ